MEDCGVCDTGRHLADEGASGAFKGRSLHTDSDRNCVFCPAGGWYVPRVSLLTLDVRIARSCDTPPRIRLRTLSVRFQH